MTEQELELLREELTAHYRAHSAQSSFAGSGGRATRNSVLDAFVRVQSQFEGSAAQFDYMYTDAIGFVTIGMGNKIDDNSPTNKAPGMNGYGPALKLPFIHKAGGAPASPAEIIQDWQTVKAAHTQDGVFDAPHDAQITQLRLSQSTMQDLIASQVLGNEAELLKSLPDFANFPADAQMAIHGMAWAMGPAFIPAYHFTTFQKAANANDWTTAKAQSAFKGAAPQRKAAHDLMFDNAARVVASGGNRDTLYYPGLAPVTKAGPGFGTVAVVLIAAGAASGGYVYRKEVGHVVQHGAEEASKLVKQVQKSGRKLLAQVQRPTPLLKKV